jgi:kynurenine formamidase
MSQWRDLAKKITNAGRWGPEDQFGTLNFITPTTVAHAATLARTGRSFSLAAPIDADGPQEARGMRRNPIHLMSIDGSDADIAARIGSWGGATQQEVVGMFGAGSARFNDDFIIMPTQASTQWDALSHVYYDGKLYNDFPSGTVTSMGASRNSIDVVAAAGHLCSRGVLLDVARWRGVPSLEPNTAISPADLDAVASAQGVGIGEGDIVVVRTGWWPVFAAGGIAGDAWLAGSPGLSWECAEWLWEHNVAAVAADNPAVEAMVPVDGEILVLHMLTLRDLGMMLGEIWNLDALGADCAADGVYEFLLTAPPLTITGAVGSPVNPVAIK